MKAGKYYQKQMHMGSAIIIIYIIKHNNNGKGTKSAQIITNSTFPEKEGQIASTLIPVFYTEIKDKQKIEQLERRRKLLQLIK